MREYFKLIDSLTGEQLCVLTAESRQEAEHIAKTAFPDGHWTIEKSDAPDFSILLDSPVLNVK